ncbi:unnamed protein product [Calypogeia fissa]
MTEEKFQATGEADFLDSSSRRTSGYEEADMSLKHWQIGQKNLKQNKRSPIRTALQVPLQQSTLKSAQQTSKEQDICDVMSEDRMGEYMGRNAVNIDALHAWFSGFEEQKEQLLPGILNEITYDHICTRLPRTEFQTLSSLNHAWDHAVGSGRFYDIRVRSHSAETLAMHSHSGHISAIA